MIIVTGGAGFIGSALIAALNKRGITDILAVDERGKDKCKNLVDLSFADYTEKTDFLKKVSEKKPGSGIEAVFHMGACSDTTETDAEYLKKNNYEYSTLLAKWATDANIRFIYASSAATYGDGSKGFSDDEGKIEQLQPLNLYGNSKQLFDLWARENGLLKKIVGLKYFNVFGPNEYHKGNMRSFILKAFEQINATGKVRLFKSKNSDYADGEYKRDFLYINDAVDMTLFFYDNPKINGLFNIGAGKARTWNDLVKAVFAAMDKSVNIEYIEMPDSIRNQYQYFTQADMTKLRKAGYKKQIASLEDAIKDYVQNYLQKGEYLEGK
ncbi:MAG: ADP-glyceromanno-heptose 6-epimerase [Phycisphaerae bacterium]|nr:ADP-glyceromanno-heptose 6-epimerase [Phycisphaerae bacterium]MDD5381145.1 ADP-glyceromanno-heptose 6-epimerase [Phycisphaerae bacterium]